MKAALPKIALPLTLLLLALPASGQTSFLRPKNASPTATQTTPPPAKAVVPAATPTPVQVPAPRTAAVKPSTPATMGPPVKQAAAKSRQTDDILLPAPVAAEVAAMAKECPQFGKPDWSQAVIKGDFNGDGLPDYVVYHGNMSCAGADNYFAPTASTGVPATVYVGVRGGNVQMVLAESQVLGFRMTKAGARQIPVFTLAGVRCGDTRQNVSTADIRYCDEKVAFSEGHWTLEPDKPSSTIGVAPRPGAEAAAIPPPHVPTLQETTASIAKTMRLGCNIAQSADLGQTGAGTEMYEVKCDNGFGYLLIATAPGYYGALNCLYADTKGQQRCRLTKDADMRAALTTTLKQLGIGDCNVTWAAAVDFAAPVGIDKYKVACNNGFRGYSVQVHSDITQQP